jgi:arsenate reductase (glutaredoxin)
VADGYVLWFDARCPASRRALELLREGGVEPDVRRFLEEPPSAGELAKLLGQLGMTPHEIARRDADEYQALRLSEKTPADEMIAALCRHPAILDRPIVVAGERAVVARPPERVKDLLDAGGAAGAVTRDPGPR